MSRIGKLPINIPEKVEVNCTESDITVKGNLVHYKLKFQT
jgi:ribosomal protein L6P/L9E